MYVNANGNLLVIMRDVNDALQIVGTPTTVTNNFWHHAVFVRDTIGGRLRLYFDGTPVVNTALTVTGLIVDAGAEQDPLFFGATRANGTATASSFFRGQLDDISYYNRALTNAEVLSLYQTGGGSPIILVQPQSQTVAYSNSAAFSVIADGIGPLAYRWLLGGAPVFGATNSTLMISGATLADAGNYQVVITNTYGSITSGVAVLIVQVAPSFPPLPAKVTYGTSGTTLAINASGTPPLTYQWQLNGTNISGATGASYTISGSATNAGSYTVVVSNAYGTATSGAVSAYFFGDLKFYAGITLGGTVGTTYRADYANALTGPTNWLLLTNLVLPYSPYLVIDPTSPGQGQRFYRAAQQ